MLRFVDLDLSVEQWDSLVEHAADLTSEPLKPLAIAVEGQGFGNAEPESIQAASTGDWRERLTSAVEDIPEAVETPVGNPRPAAPRGIGAKTAAGCRRAGGALLD
jgi:hypothetical protein